MSGRVMRLSRAERSVLVDWWFTVDRVLLASILAIVGTGLLLSLAASPAIAIKRGLPPTISSSVTSCSHSRAWS